MSKDQRVLIVGDWVLDDNWLAGVHRASTSLRTGSSHYRVLHSPGSPVQAFCGAGRLASILYGAREDAEQTDVLFPICGIGVWKHQTATGKVIADDTQLLESMFAFDFRKTQAPSAVTSQPLSSRPPNITLHNLAACLNGDHHAEDYFATTRVYRLFHRSGDKLLLQSRTDWEHTPKKRDTEGAPEWVSTADATSFHAFMTERGIAKENICAVIVKDLIKGVVTETLIRVLAGMFNNVPWFVSTKRWNAPWIQTLSQVDLRLFLVPQTAATAALAVRDDLDSWIAPRKAQPSKGAMKCITEIEKAISGLNATPLIAISPSEGSVLAKRADEYVVDQRQGPTGSGLVGWATAFYSAMCAHLLRTSAPLANVVCSSVDFAEEWVRSEVKFLEKPDIPAPAPPCTLTLRKKSLPADDGHVLSHSWQKEWAAWTSATSTNGIIAPKNEQPRLELCRGMTAVDGFVCFDRKKRKALSELVHKFRQFAHGIERHEAVQLMADPGSGKTHLVKCLSEASGLRCVPFNVTHVNKREDILSWFDTIVTTQAHEKDRPLLVFIDEINAPVAGHFVYDAFLTPLEENVYVRGGCTFHIKPCVWVFAGTVTAERKEPVDKYADFRSRLTLDDVRIGRMDRLEKVYLAAQLVRARFPDVRRISESALDQFAAGEGSVRDLRTLVNRLRDVQNSEVSKANFPGHTADDNESFVDLC